MLITIFFSFFLCNSNRLPSSDSLLLCLFSLSVTRDKPPRRLSRYSPLQQSNAFQQVSKERKREACTSPIIISIILSKRSGGEGKIKNWNGKNLRLLLPLRREKKLCWVQNQKNDDESRTKAF